MKFQSSKEVRAHLKKVSIGPEWSILAFVIISLIFSLIMSGVINTFVDTFWWRLIVFTSTLCFVSTILWIYGAIEVPTGHKGVLTLFGSRILSNEYDLGYKSLLDEGTHWLPPFILGTIIVSFQEESVPLNQTVCKVKVALEHKALHESLAKATFVDIMFSNIRFHFLVCDPFVYIDTGISGFLSELQSVLAEVIRDVGIGCDTENIYNKDVNNAILGGIRGSQRSGHGADVDRWGIIPLSVSTPEIGPESEDVKAALEGGYRELLDRIRETSEADTFLLILKKIKEANPGVDEAFLNTVAMRMIKGLTQPGRDFFFHNYGPPGSEGFMFGAGTKAMGQTIIETNESN